jgi:hypothetical protein
VVVGFVQLTNDGQAKSGPLATDGSRVYLTEILPGPRRVVVQVSAKGGDTAPLATSLKQPRVLDLSRDGAELLLASQEAVGPDSLWIQPVMGGSPRRVGSIFADDARFGADGATIIYGRGARME